MSHSFKLSLSLLTTTLGLICLSSQAFAQTTGGGSAARCLDFQTFSPAYSPATISGPEAADPNLSSWASNWSMRVERPILPAAASYGYGEVVSLSPADDTYMFPDTDVFFTNTFPVYFGELEVEAIHGGDSGFDYVIWDASNTTIIASGTYITSGVPTMTPYTATINFTNPSFGAPVGEVHLVGRANEMGVLKVCVS